MVGPGKTVSASRAEAKLYLAKAEEVLAEAGSGLAADRHDAAMLNALHAAISVTGAVTAALASRRSADPDHQRAIDLLQQVAGSSDEIGTRVRQLRTLLSKKNAVEYESRKVTPREARDAVERAARIVRWAGEVVHRARLWGPRPSHGAS